MSIRRTNVAITYNSLIAECLYRQSTQNRTITECLLKNKKNDYISTKEKVCMYQLW